MGDRTGQQLGNYRLTRLLGQGGFADVYLGEHIHLGTEAAIKVLATRLIGDELERFLSEARTIARLKHAHIVRVLEFGIDDTTPFLVMDYASGGTLRQRHPRGTFLPLPTIVSYVKQVADALQHAHDSKLIHRDIKPENMLLGDKGEVLLSDFGIAIVAQSSRYDRTQDTIGTIAYMAPEQIQAHPRPASDQYSLGIVVYEWLSGDRPFNGSFTEIAAKHVLMPPPSLREKLPALSLFVEQVVLTALAKDPKQRFGSMQAFASALEHASQSTMTSSWHIPPRITPSPQPPQPTGLLMPLGDSVISTELIKRPQQPVQSTGMGNWSNQTSGPTGVWTPTGQIAQPTGVYLTSTQPAQPPAMVTPLPISERPYTRPPSGGVSRRPGGGVSRRTIVLGLGLAGLAVAGGGIAWLASSQGLFSPVASKQTPTPTLQDHPSSGSSPSPTATPEPAPSPTPIPIPVGTLLYIYRGHSGYVLSVAWSPDGNRIASGEGYPNGKTVQVWDAADGGNAFTYRGHSGYVLAVAWSPDGKRIASGSATVQVWDAADGGNAFTYRGHSSGVNAVAWSPDGKRIASGGNDNTVQVWDAADGGHVYTYRGHSDVVTAVAWSPDGRRIASGSADHTVQVWEAV